MEWKGRQKPDREGVRREKRRSVHVNEASQVERLRKGVIESGERNSMSITAASKEKRKPAHLELEQLARGSGLEVLARTKHQHASFKRVTNAARDPNERPRK